MLALERAAAGGWGDASAAHAGAEDLTAASLPPPPRSLTLKRELTARSKVALDMFQEGGEAAAADVATAEDLLVTAVSVSRFETN
jgi:hypothetical protein